MTHLSDYTYLERSVHEGYVWLWFIFHVWSIDRFESLRFKRLARFELKSVITLFILLCLPLQMYFDVASTRIKYIEGYWVNPFTKEIISKPKLLWSEADKAQVLGIDYSLMIGFSLQSGIFFLLQSFWNYISKSVAKATFMASWEFKIYLVWAVISVALFPLLQFGFRYDELLTEVVPQLAMCCVLFIIACLGIMSHFRFKRLIKFTEQSANAKVIIEKLEYFMDMNILLSIVLGIGSTTLGIICVDGLSAAKTLNSDKFWSDLLICNTNFCYLLIWVILILIFYPRRTQKFANMTSSGNTMSLPNYVNPNSVGAGNMQPPSPKLYPTPMPPTTYPISQSYSTKSYSRPKSPSSPRPVQQSLASAGRNTPREYDVHATNNDIVVATNTQQYSDRIPAIYHDRSPLTRQTSSGSSQPAYSMDIGSYDIDEQVEMTEYPYNPSPETQPRAMSPAQQLAARYGSHDDEDAEDDSVPTVHNPQKILGYPTQRKIWEGQAQWAGPNNGR